MKFWRSKTILLKPEAVYATDPAPTGAANAILATEVTFTPMEGSDVPRNLERGYFAADATVAAELRAVLTFSVELVGSGTLGTPPAWGPLLRAFGVAEIITAATKVEYVPITDEPESVACYFDVDGTLHKLGGARGTGVLGITANGNPKITATLTGLFSVPAEAARPVPDFSSFKPPQIASSANTSFTIDGDSFVMRDYQFDLGGVIEPRILVGQEAILITDRKERLSVTVEAVPLTTYNPFSAAQNGTLKAISLTHGSIVGRKVQIDHPAALQQRPGAYQQTQGVLEWPLTFLPQPTDGNDQWKITLT